MEHVAIGKTVEDAINKGLKEKGWAQEEVEIRIVDEGKKGLLNKRPAVVVISKKSKHEPPQEDRASLEERVLQFLRNTEENKEDTTAAQEKDVDIAVKTAPSIGHIYWEGACLAIPNDCFAQTVLLVPPCFTNIYRNGHIIRKRSVLQVNDNITHEKLTHQIEDWVDIQISKEEMEVSIQLKKEVAYECIPLIIHTEEGWEIRFKEEKRASIPFSVSDIYEYLQRKGIVYGIDFEAIQNWLEKGMHASVPTVIVRGKAKKDGEPTKFIPLYKMKTEQSEEQETMQTVDWFRLQEIGSVKAGEKIVEIIPATKGRNGVNIFGNPILANDGTTLSPSLGQGVAITEDGRYIFATIDGRPEFYKNRASVYPLHIHRGDLTLKSGSIKFHGDIVIQGNVMDGLSVEATGNVSVQGSVTYGKIVAGRNITVHSNVIGSHLIAGGYTSFYRSLLYKVERVVHGIQYILQAYHQLRQSSAFSLNDLASTGIGRLIKLLIETKLQDFEQEVKDIHAFYHQQMMTKLEETTRWINRLAQFFTGFGPFHIHSIEEIEELYQEGQALQYILNSYTALPSYIVANYVHGSKLQASDKVRIIGLGSYNSDIFAGEEILITGKEGIVRGGKLEAGQKITVQELGGTAEVRTVVCVQSDTGDVLADIVYPGTIIQINKAQYNVKKPGRFAQFKRNPKTGIINALMLKEEEE
jgi:predicted RNA-binding protein Jag